MGSHISDVVHQCLDVPERLKLAKTTSPSLCPWSWFLSGPALCSHCPRPEGGGKGHESPQHPPTAPALLGPITKPPFLVYFPSGFASVGCCFFQTYSETTKNTSFQACHIKYLKHSGTFKHASKEKTCSLSMPCVPVLGSVSTGCQIGQRHLFSETKTSQTGYLASCEASTNKLENRW